MQNANGTENQSARHSIRIGAAGHLRHSEAAAGGYTRVFARELPRFRSSIAARFQDQELTYAELNGQSERLAERLRQMGAGPEVIVAVCIERSLELLISLLAVWKAGGAYVVLDPEYPRERLSLILNDCRTKILITRRQYCARFAEPELKIVTVENASNAGSA